MNRLTGKIITVLALALFLAPPASATIWHVPGDFETIQGAIDDFRVSDGDRIVVGPGNHFGAYVYKEVEIKGEPGAVINDGPLHPAGLTYGFRLENNSHGTTICQLWFDGVDLAIMNGAAVNNVTVTQNTFVDTIQAISNWSGSGWEISHNEIIDLKTRCGGGIGILVADFSGGYVQDNLVSHNHIYGTLHVSESDCGGYNGSGIVLYADFRWGREGAEEISYNRVVKNHISLTSDRHEVVDVVAFELTDTSENDCNVILYNLIGFNDFRGTELQIVLTPSTLDNCNAFSRNMGDNRGHGEHPPSLFFPSD